MLFILGSKRQLIMFGDATPHEYECYTDILEQFPYVEEQLDWRQEADELLRMVCLCFDVHNI